MTISRVGSQAGGTFADGAGSGSRAFPSNVTAGNVVWFAATIADSTHTFVAGDLTKSAGTATLDTIRLVQQRSQDMVEQGYFVSNAIWCAKVTGSGSLTLQASGSTAGAFWLAASGEISSTIGFDSNPIETQNGNGTGTDSSSPATTGNGTSAGGAYFIAMLGIGSPGAVTITLGGSFATAYNESSGSHMVGEASDRIVSSGTTDQGSWTLSGTSDGWCAVLGVIKESASAPALNPHDAITGSKRNRPGRGPYSRGKYARPIGVTSTPTASAIDGTAAGAVLAATSSLITGAATGDATAVGATLTAASSLVTAGARGDTGTHDSITGSARNRPGRGPYSLGRYYRPIGETGAPTSSAIDGTASGAVLAATSSLVAGAATGAATASGGTLAAASSLVAASATGGAAATAATLTAASSLIAGAAAGAAGAAGATLAATSSLVAGAASGAATATAATLQATASLLPGAASGAGDATASGATVTASSSLVAGAASGAAAASGITATATASLIAGAANGVRNATAAGVVASVQAIIVPGLASGNTTPEPDRDPFDWLKSLRIPAAISNTQMRNMAYHHLLMKRLREQRRR